jgi:hypothetical protein
MAKKNSLTNKIRNGLKVKSDLEKLEDKIVHKNSPRIGITKKNKSQSKRNRKISKNSKKINRK